MRKLILLLFAVSTLSLAGCTNEEAQTDDASSIQPSAETDSKTGPEIRAEAPKPEVKEVIVMENGLNIQVIQEGEGAEIQNGQAAHVHYTGWLYDESAPEGKGNKFDSSRDRGELLSFTVGVGQVIQGWDEGVAGMKVGERRILTIPPELGYGNRDIGNGLIPAGSTLLFDVELFEIGNR